MRNFFRSLAVLLVIVVLQTVLVFADDLTIYDKFTGQEIISNNTTLQSSVNLSNKCRYDRTISRYIYTTSFATDSDVESTVYSGMIVSEVVSISTGQNAKIEVYRDGELIDEDDYENLNQQGHYKVLYEDQELFSFIIVNKLTSIIKGYDMPDGFRIISVTRDGESYPQNGSSVSFEGDGNYVVSYKCTSTGARYTLNCTIDNTVPTLEFEGLPENKIASGPVKFIKTEKDSSVRVILEDKEIKPMDNTLVESGNYKVAVYDQAGNNTVYIFKIKVYFDTSAWVVVLLFVVIIGVIVGYITYSRKHLRVR